MLRIDKSANRLVHLTKSTLADAAHWELHLQRMICSNPDSFCAEIDEHLWVIGQEVRPSEALPDRIDILAIDDQGKSVVIELKRGSHKLQLLQAVSYAGMVSSWPAERFIETLAANFQQSANDARDAIVEHIGSGSDIASINNAQRILLIAEEFDPALLIAAEWLHEKYDVDVRCYRLQLSQENGSDYLTCTCIYPPIEIAALTRGSSVKPTETATAWTDWNTALAAVENLAVRNYFEIELANHQEARLRDRTLLYRFGGKRRFWVGCRKKYAYVWQEGRFDDDYAYWRDALSQSDYVQLVNENRALRFRLISPSDFEAFGNAIKNKLGHVEFTDSADFQQPQSIIEN
jgi:hypothetical protein